MKLALEISFYVFLLVALFGGLLLVWLFRWIFGEKDILALFPQTKPLPMSALEEVKKLLKKMREQVPQASPARRSQMMFDLERMDKIVQEVKFRTETRQANYYKLCEHREKVWHAVDEIVGQMSSWEQLFGKKKNLAYTQTVQYYKELNERIEAAAKHAKFQGELLLAETRSRGVYQQNAYLLNPPKNATSASSEPEDSPNPGENTEIAKKPQSPSSPELTPATKMEQNASKKEEAESALLEESSSNATMEKLSNIRPALLQTDFPKIGINVRKYKYMDATFHLDFQEHGILRHYDFEGSIFRGIHFSGIHQYDHCNFRQVDFTGATWLQVLQPHRFDHCDFTQANLSDCRFDFTAFYYCRFDQSQWSRIQFRKVKFVSCYLDEVQWHHVDLSQVVMSKDMLTRLDFSACEELPQNHPDRAQVSEEKSLETPVPENDLHIAPESPTASPSPRSIPAPSASPQNDE